MKIDRADSLQHPQTGGTKITASPTGKSFGEILKKTVSQSMAAPQPGILQGLPPVGGISGFSPAALTKDLVGRADQLLCLLEDYQKKLSGDGLPLQDAYVSMKAIEDRADELSPHIESLPEGDGFRDFLNRIVITASVEALKFRRGDYQ